MTGTAGKPAPADGTVVFHDDDFRDVGEAMLLIRRKDGTNGDLLASVEVTAGRTGLGTVGAVIEPGGGVLRCEGYGVLEQLVVR